MAEPIPRYRRYLTAVTGLLLLALLYGAARPPRLPADEAQAMAAEFRFSRSELAEVPGVGRERVRPVHPSLDRISSWISATGAAVAFGDFDHDGLPNDLCSVDPRSNRAVVAPAPGTGERYRPFVLAPPPATFDDAVMAPIGCLTGDYNEDGLSDLLVYYWGRTPIAFLRRDAPLLGRLESAAYAPVVVGPRDEVWSTNAMTQADVDGDGHVDLVIGNYFPDGAPTLDADGTGTLAMHDSMSRAFNGGHNRILLWAAAESGAEPSVRFEEAPGVFDPKIAQGWTLAAAAGDLDGDLLPEIFFANDFGPDRLLHNRSRPGQVSFALLEGEKELTTPTSKVLGRDSFKGMGVDFGDVNGDGLLDIYVSNIAEEYALEESHQMFLSTGETERMLQGEAPFRNDSEAMGLARSAFSWEARLADFNNDGVLEALQATGFVRGETDRWAELQELAMGNDELIQRPWAWPRFQPGDDLSGHHHNPFFVRSSSGRYFDLAEEVGIADVHVSRGIATADVDGDGRLDFAVANQWDTSYFYRNTSPLEHSFLGLRLFLPVAGEEGGETSSFPGAPGEGFRGRPAIGATAVVHQAEGRLVGQVEGGNGHSGARSQALHFGLGRSPAERVRVDLEWRDPGGTRSRGTLWLEPGWHTVTLGTVSS